MFAAVYFILFCRDVHVHRLLQK